MAFIGCILVLTLASAIGYRLLAYVFDKDQASSERAILGVGLGLGIIAYIIYGLGLISLLTLPILWGLTIAGIAVLYRDVMIVFGIIVRAVRGAIGLLLGRWGVLYAIIAWILLADILLNLIGALAPEIIFDAIWYHLTMAKFYLLGHKVYYLKFLTYGVFPRNIEMLFTLSMALGGEITAKLLHYSFGLLTVGAIFVFGKRYLTKETAFLAGSIFYMMSNVNMLSATAYIDLGLTFFSFLAVVSLLFWSEGRREAWLVISGVFLGIALGSKHQALLLGIVMTILTVAASWQGDRRGLRTTIRNLIILGAPAIVIAAPWYINAYAETGNPVYPLFNELFGTGESFEQSMFAGTNKTGWYDGHSIIHVVTLLWKLTLGEFEGWLSPLIIISLPLLLLLKKVPRFLRSWLWFSGLFYLAYFAIVPFYTMRYFLPVVPVLSLIVAYLFIEAIKSDKWLKVVVVFALLVTFTGNLGFLAFKNMPSAKAAIGLESRTAYLDGTLGWYKVNGYINGPESRGKVKVLVNGAPLFYYFEFPFEYGAGPKADSIHEKYQLLREGGFTHVMTLVGEITDPIELKEVELVFKADQPPGARSNAARSVRLYEILR